GRRRSASSSTAPDRIPATTRSVPSRPSTRRSRCSRLGRPRRDKEQETQMAEVVLFHHALGLTPGIVAFADELRGAGHTVHTPDLFEGRTFDTIAEGVTHAQEIGFGEIIERGVR